MGISKKQRICVTGAGGYISSWIVKRLLERGYDVRGTVRDPGNEKKVAHLKALEGASKGLELVQADLLDFQAIADAVRGCDGVFHVASPIIYDTADPQKDVLDPAVKGTLNVMEACLASAATVKRIVLTSSSAAVAINPNRPPDAVVDEDSWTDEEFCRQTKQWYPLSKVLAEKAAWAFAKEHNLDLITVCPSVVIGPLLHPEANGSNLLIRNLLNGTWKKYRNVVWGYVHIQDVVEAHLLAYETTAASGRYYCSAVLLHDKELIQRLLELYPEYTDTVPKEQDDSIVVSPYKVSNKKVRDLGVQFQSLDKCLADCVESLRQQNFL